MLNGHLQAKDSHPGLEAAAVPAPGSKQAANRGRQSSLPSKSPRPLVCLVSAFDSPCDAHAMQYIDDFMLLMLLDIHTRVPHTLGKY